MYYTGHSEIEVRIQDVNPENEKIFENGWMYVGPPHAKRHFLYFAPYFTNECSNPGLSRISGIIRIDPCLVADLLSMQIKPPEAPGGQHLLNWRNRLYAIRRRAVIEEWQPQNFVNLFYLDRPESFRSPPLTKQIHNNSGPIKQIPPTVPPGFTLRYDELLANSSWALGQPPCNHQSD